MLGRAAAFHTDCVDLLNVLGYGHQVRHRAEGFAEEVGVESGYDHAYAPVGQGLHYLDYGVVKELGFVYAYNLDSIAHFEHLLRVADWKGFDLVGIVRDHELVGIADVYGRLEYGYLLVRELGPAHSSDKLFCFAREHGTADKLYGTGFFVVF